MNRKDLRDIGLAVVLAGLLCLGITICGCSKVESFGLFGGNSQVTKVYVLSPGAGFAGQQQPEPGPATSRPATAGAPITVTINANQADGGLLGNPPAGLIPSLPTVPTTQPATTQPVK